ncbi:MAG: outer membrane beta-barrel protein [Pirellulales bacterium]
MVRKWIAGALAACLPLVAFGDDLSALATPVDLAAPAATADFENLLQPVGLVRGDDGTANRFYIAPIVGASWGEMVPLCDCVPAMNGNLLTAGGAVGMAFARPLGQWRTEVEGRYRDGFERNLPLFPDLQTPIGITDNWSAMFNVWRDIPVTGRFGAYGGGGIGAGGSRFLLSETDGIESLSSNQQTAAFAWQVGGGFIHAVSDRVTLDLGYRYYSTAAATSTIYATAPGFPPTPFDNLNTQFLASELLFSLRIYEPFRR